MADEAGRCDILGTHTVEEWVGNCDVLLSRQSIHRNKKKKEKQRWDCVMSVATIRLGCSLFFSFFLFEGKELVTDILGSEQSICTVAKTVGNFMIICGSVRLFL